MAGDVDLDDLAGRATDAAQDWAPGCTINRVEPLTGGTSSLTFTCAVDGGPAGSEQIVLKVAPPGLEPVRNRDVARQARVMRPLAGAPGVRVPTVLFEDDGDPPDVPPFHGMNLVQGECLEPLLQSPPPRVMPFVPDRALAAAAMLAALHRFDPTTELAGEKEITLTDEVKRWTRAFGTVDERMSARHLEAEELLLDRIPAALPSVICHGDYRLGNMLCDRGEVAAIIDWEIWALSDPRMDLAWFLFFTDEAEHPMAMNHGPTGMPSADTLFAAYVAAAGHEPVDFEWFHCLIRYKEAAATSLLVKRMIKGADATDAERWISGIQACTVDCIERLEGWKPDTA